jgi:hypothetical protein
VGFPVGIGCGDPRSQKRDLGHPSVLPTLLPQPTESGAPNDTDRVACRVPWYPTSREKRARCGHPIFVAGTGSRSFLSRLASSSQLLGMTKGRLGFPSGLVAGIPGLKRETWGTLRLLPTRTMEGASPLSFSARPVPLTGSTGRWLRRQLPGIDPTGLPRSLFHASR